VKWSTIELLSDVKARIVSYSQDDEWNMFRKNITCLRDGANMAESVCGQYTTP